MAYPVGNWENSSNWEQSSEVIDISDSKLALPTIHGYIETSIPNAHDQFINILMVAGWVASTREDLLRSYEDRLTILGEPAQKTSLEILNSVSQAGIYRLNGVKGAESIYDKIFDSLLARGTETVETLTSRLNKTVAIKTAFLDGDYPSYSNHVIWSSTESHIKSTSIKLFKAAARSEYSKSVIDTAYELDATKFEPEIFKNFARMPHWDNLMNDSIPLAREEILAERRFINWVRVQGRILGSQQSIGRTALY